MDGILLRIKQEIVDFFKKEDGVGVVEVILILVILIGFVLLFKNNIKPIVDNSFSSISNDSGKVLSN